MCSCGNYIAVFVTLTVSILTVEGLRCPLYWQRNGDSCYRFRYRYLKTYGEAEAYCQSQNSHLIKFETVSERNWTVQAIKLFQQARNASNVQFWTGLTCNGTGGSYKWADSSPVDPSILSGQAVTAINQRNLCVIVANNNGLLTSMNCATPQGAICERHIGIPLICNADQRWQSFNNYCYKVYGRKYNGATWTTAQQLCDKQGGNLFTAESSPEEDVIQEFAYANKLDFWIGVRSYPQGNTYTWLLAKNNFTLSPRLAYWSTYPNLQSSQYNNTCAYVKYQTSQDDIGWSTDTCSVQKHFVCKKPEGSCQPGWLAHQNRCFQFNTQIRLGWNDANQYCTDEGGSLLGIYGFTATKFINSYLGSFQAVQVDSFWIGATDNNTANYTWPYDQEIRFQNWAVNPPDNTPNQQDCVYISTDDRNGTWQTTSSCGLKKAFVCQIGYDKQVNAVPRQTLTLTCDDRWTLQSGKCYQFNDTKKSWQDARAACQTQGADLATVDNRGVHNLIINTIDTNDNEYWIGLNDLRQNGAYVWSASGAKMQGFTGWCKNEPNDLGGTENCVQYFTANKCWNDRGCSTALKFICMKDPQHIPIGPVISTTSLPISAKCGVGWEERPQSPYCYSFRREVLSWQDARDVCISINSDLASVHDGAEQVFIQSRVSSYTNFFVWLGGTDRSREGGWSWSDGTPFQYVSWATDEPNGNTRENCLNIYTSAKNQLWNDGACTVRYGFVCKKAYGTVTTVPPPKTPSVQAGKFLGCPDLWTRHGNSCWYFGKGMKSAPDARAACMKGGGYLATINSQDDQNFLVANLPRPKKNGNGIFNGGGAWIGLSDRLQEGYFVWDDATPVAFTNWGINEPNNFYNLNEDCVGAWLLDGSWSDFVCSTPLPAYVCRSGLSVVSSTGANPVLQGCLKPNRGFGYGASCYKLFTQPSDWSSALSTCMFRNNGLLAKISDRYVQAFLASYIDTNTDSFWIGLSDQVKNGIYTWSQGETDAFTFWSSDHTGNEKNTCVAMRATHPLGVWDNRNCSEKHNFICEYARTGFTKAPVTTMAAIPCPSGWASFATFCYKFFVTSSTWIQARSSCQSYGGDLVSILSQQENDFVWNTVIPSSSRGPPIFIGLNDWDTEGRFVWSDKSAVTFTAWNPNEPNSYNDEDCVATVGNKKWVDIYCFAKFSYVCKVIMGATTPQVTTPPFGIQSSACGVESLWRFYNGSCYMTGPVAGPNSGLNWYAADRYCLSYGSHLASIHTPVENSFVNSLIKNQTKSELWLGLNELEVPGNFRWINNEKVDFVNWDNNEPNDEFGAEKCVSMKTRSGNWMDNNCNLKQGFICKKTVGTPPPTTPPPPVISGGCDDPSFMPSQFSNKCYKIVTSQALNWNQSQQYCQTQFKIPHQLASIGNEMEQAFLTSYLNGLDHNVWLGLSSQRFFRQFVWTDNSELRYTNWAARQPSGRNIIIKGQFTQTEPCVEMITSKGLTAGQWNDINCNVQNYFICQGKKIQGTPDNYTPTTPTCSKPEYTPRGTSCYKFIGSPEATWQKAQALCQTDGAVLVSINDVYENAFVEAQMGQNVTFWTGLQYNKATQSFNWQRNWPVSFSLWDRGEPSNGPSDFCVTSTNGKWDNTDCSRSLAYVCEINTATVPPPTPTPVGHCKRPGDVLNGYYCYYFSIFDLRDWPGARYICSTREMDLVSIADVYELQYIFDIALNSRNSQGKRLGQNVWLGLNKGLSSGFQWTDGSPLSFTNWNSGEPSDPMNSTREECVEMYRDNAKWNDVSCFYKKAFVCKGNAVLPAGYTAPTKPSVPINTQNPPSNTQHTHRPTVTPRKGFTFQQQTGYITGQVGGGTQNKVTDIKHGLYGGALAAVIVVIVVVIGIGILIGILFWRKMHPTASPIGRKDSGFDNALYSKDKDEVDIDGSSA